ncbi:MAG TPA: glycine cleavage system aminomethyltransferase GcvT [Firmicutes bacterium]|uniref:Aminomethyltransferase n=1 Tax=Capillibacterium thermochitinicola TaxID=2699427 RepID=A0A8J6HSB7_9FIRM|nr:glycine cleavage system aminomethyltransferase GcvT [Capillibacterium thermochitinicola]MBA2133236.1 glycine cleavage system aminomethyltransferase GcvT [Capillibacterium thermochitinicola]HHW12188.1 glycine cleavage system aminomethyltransferase GcvT [Bacillota bacterium]
MAPSPEKKTPLYESCLQAGARFTEFAGWQMPLQFAGILQEVHAVRNHAGLFDVSHMGELLVAGPEALSFLDRMLTNNVATVDSGQVIYTFLCNPEGGTIDDLLVYRIGQQEFLLVVNAINTETVFSFLQSQATGYEIELRDYSPLFALLALQGPAAAAILTRLFPDVLPLKTYRFKKLLWQNEELIISRTGYTGEDGFEIFIPPTLAATLWADLLRAGEKDGLVPAGLGARDLLRLEAGLPLYGHELSTTISPVQAGLERFIAWEKPDFCGRSPLLREKNDPNTPRRIGLIADRSAIPRPGMTVYWDQQPIGQITSGSYSPTLEKALGMALVHPVPPPGTPLSLAMRGTFRPAECVQLPFYKRKR